MKLTKQQTLELENAILKTNLAKVGYDNATKELNRLSKEANDLAKKFGGKDYKENVPPSLNIETNELTFKE